MIAFVGDMIFGDQPVLFGFGFDSHWKKCSYDGIFDNVMKPFDEVDTVIANFESIIRTRNSSYAVNDWSMCCDDTIVEQLTKANISVVSVANNHIYDFGADEFNNTIHKIQKAGISVIGTKSSPFVKINDKGSKVAIIAATYVGRYDKDSTDILFKLTKEEWSNLCEQCRDCDKILAYVHWGNEYVVHPTQEQVDLANEIIAVGIDGIIGHHPHILQESYHIHGKPVVFSLGNFISDYWQERLRKTSILMYSCKDDLFQEISCFIDESGAPKICGEIKPHKFFDTDIEISTNEMIANQRSIARKETIIKILKNLHRYKHKMKYASWLLRRVVYIIRYGRKEKNDPNIIYDKYKG